MQLRFKNTLRYPQCTEKLQQMFSGLPQQEAQRWLAVLLGHSDWAALHAEGPKAEPDEALPLDQISLRRQYQVNRLLELAEIEESDALAVINALRPSADCPPCTVNEKQEACAQDLHPLAMGLGDMAQARFERELQALMRSLIKDSH